MLRLRWPLVLGYLAASIGLIYVLVPRMGTEIFPDSNAPIFRIRLRAPAGTRIEETERIVLQALDVIQREAGADNVEITSDFVGVMPSSYPVDLIHLFTSGPQEAIIQVALKPDAPRGEATCASVCGRACGSELPACQFSFEAGDIVGQVMSFGSPTPIEVAVLGSNLAGRLRYAQKVQAQLAPLPFLRDLQFAQELNYPTLDININRERAGQFGLTMADVVAFGRAGHIVLAVHAAELLARSELRQRISDPGATAAKSHAKHRRAGRSAGHAKRPLRDRS